MQEANLIKSNKKKPTGFFIEGVNESQFIKSNTTIVKNSDGGYTIPVTEYMRIPYNGSPYPLGEDMEIRMRATINSTPLTNQAFYMLGKWRTISGDGELDLKRRTDGRLSFDIGSIDENTEIASTQVVPVGTEFELYWRRQGTGLYCELNDVVALTTSNATQRQRPVDWVLGGYLNASNAVQVSSRANWTISYLKISRGIGNA